MDSRVSESMLRRIGEARRTILLGGGKPLRAAIEKLGDHLQEIHAKDIVEVVDDCNPRSGRPYRDRRFVDRMIDQGGVDQYSIFTGLKNIGYNGYAVVESGLVSGLDSFGVAEGCYNAIRDIMSVLGM